MRVVMRTVAVLAKKVSRDELVEKSDGSFLESSAGGDGKWLYGTQYALVEDEDFDPNDVEFTQLEYNGVVINSFQSEDERAELTKAVDAEDFGVEKGSPQDEMRAHVLNAALTNTEADMSEFFSAYRWSCEDKLGFPEDSGQCREANLCDEEISLEDDLPSDDEYDYDTFMAFDVAWYSAEIDDSHIADMELKDWDDEEFTGRRIDPAFLSQISADEEYERMRLIGFGVCRFGEDGADDDDEDD